MEIAFETERLVARRRWSSDDAEGALELYGDPEVVRFIGNQLIGGKGYASEMGRALLALGFHEHPADVLHAVVEPPNEPSMAVARRIGMEHVGRTARYYGLELEHLVARRAPASAGGS